MLPSNAVLRRSEGELSSAGGTKDVRTALLRLIASSLGGLSKEQVDRLRDEHAIYLVGSGRINVAGITPSNIDRLCKAIVSVL